MSIYASGSGAGQALSVTFTPNYSANYTAAAKMVFFNVLTAGQAVQNLSASLSTLPIPASVTGDLKVSLDAAADSFNRGNQNAGINQLQAFQNKVKAQSGVRN